MKCFFINIVTLLIGVTIMFSACTDENLNNQETKAELVDVKIKIGTLPMESINVEPHSRAIVPLPPEIENPMKTIAVIQFDKEGNMLKLNDTNHPYFHYITLTSEDNPNGQITTNLNEKLVAMNDTTRICLLANMTEEQISELVFDKDKNRYLLWSEFEVKNIVIDYILEDSEGVSIGHVNEIYMFGYFEGLIDSGGNAVSGDVTKPLSIAMSRLIARLEMYIQLGEGVTLPEDYEIYTGFTGIGREVYLVPDAAKRLPERVHDHVKLDPVNRTELIKNTSETGQITPLYFYMAPHIVENDPSKVTKFIIWCVPKGTSEEDLMKPGEDGGEALPNPETNFVSIMMCNDPLNENPNVEGAYWLNRNSLYHVNITLKYKPESRAVGNGEYVIDLNELIK